MKSFFFLVLSKAKLNKHPQVKLNIVTKKCSQKLFFIKLIQL